MKLHFRKSFEVTGYANTERGFHVCLNCAGNNPDDNPELYPVFLDSECDYLPTCDNCHSEIECSVLDYQS